ncbi:MAG: GNAT family N-acetyltransferase [Lachnospiraceae bacterium]|nr:GNAT family N-acetyltransferase [Lachnospiraceae bacterium]
MSKHKDVTLTEVNESNFLEAMSLRVAESQRSFVADAAGILARGYVFRADRARVYAVQVQNELVGLLLVRDLKEEPACYDLQQLMIDARHQNRGYGTSALGQLLSSLKQEHAFDMVEVCVKKDDTAALHLYEKAGFVDSGYIDEEAADSLNLVYYL